MVELSLFQCKYNQCEYSGKYFKTKYATVLYIITQLLAEQALNCLRHVDFTALQLIMTG